MQEFGRCMSVACGGFVADHVDRECHRSSRRDSPGLRKDRGFYLWRGSLTEDYGRVVVGGLGGLVGESASPSGAQRR
jgi:hypothetical protein